MFGGSVMVKKWNMILDVARCENCRICFLVTKDEHIGNEFPGYAAPQPPHGHNWIDIQKKERGRYPVVEANFMPVMCNHCDDAPCMKAAKGGAVSKRDDGIVIIDPKKSKGQKAIVDACPYGAVYWNEEEQIPQAWIFDAHLLDQGWTKPRAEKGCPTGVYRSIKVEDQEMRRIKEQEGLEVLQPECESKPRVYYKNLHLMTKCFVAGSVLFDVDGIEECAEDAEVILKQNDSEVARVTTDIFGEFKIDKLEKKSGQYKLEVNSDSRGSISAEFDLGDESLYLGTMTLAVGA
jgi:Fe-S-cluster-containing dehydrogenase component